MFHSLFFPSNISLEEYLGLGVHGQHLPGSNDKRARRHWQETGEAAWLGGPGRGVLVTLEPHSLVHGCGMPESGPVLRDLVECRTQYWESLL